MFTDSDYYACLQMKAEGLLRILPKDLPPISDKAGI